MFRGFRIGIILTAFLCIAGLSFSYAASYAPYSKTKNVKITTAVNVRTDATTSAKSLGVLSKGTVKTIYGYKKDKSGAKWYKLYYSSSKQGYVHSKYAKVTSTDPYIKYNSSFKGTVTGNDVNIRTGASTSSSKAGTYSKGKTLTVVGYLKDSKGGTWYAFKVSGKTRFISATYVKKNTSTASTSKATAYKAYDVPKLAKSLGANVRSSASLSGAKKGYLSKNSKTSIFGYQKDSTGTTWYRVSYNGGYGYISKSVLTVLSDTYVPYSKAKSATTTAAVNIRTQAWDQSAKAGTYAKGAKVSLMGYAYDQNKTTWYAVKYSSKTRFVCGSYVTTKTVTEPVDEKSFETNLSKFPASYQSALKALHKEHPNWVFNPVNTGLSWSSVISKESKVGVNVVAGSSPASYKSMEKGAYNWSSGKYVTWDSGGWVSADQRVIQYYLDPRNFLNESGIFQFMDNRFSSANTVESVRKITKGTFMDDSKFTFDKSTGYTHYSDAIYGICKKIGVNPDVIASMIIQEQGASGNSRSVMGKGTSSGSYKGYYNFLNIGAWRTSTMDAVTRGLWYAKEQGWNSRIKSITGGAQYYYNNYTKSGQYTLYFKKFNTANGASKVATHQYMSNVQGASGEANNLKKAFASSGDAKLTFAIPVYTSMPASKCALPPSTGDNNNFSSKLGVISDSKTWKQSLDTTNGTNGRYTAEHKVSGTFKTGTTVKIAANRTSRNPKATISGTGNKTIQKGTNKFNITVTSTSGLKRTYTIIAEGK